MGGRLHGLDALRGIAALFVFAEHVLYAQGRLGFAPVAGFSVDLFFMLSGFVLTRTYEQRLATGQMGKVAFMRARYRRLLPAMAIGTSIGLLWALQTAGVSLDLLLTFAAILLFLPALWRPDGYFYLNGPSYSLFIEVWLNALHAILFVKLANRTLAVLCGVAVVGYVALIFTGMKLHGANATQLLPTMWRGVACYTVGILLFRLYGDRPLPHPRAAILAYPVLAISLANLLPLAAVTLILFCLAPLLLRSAVGLGYSRAAYWLGALSFPLYAVHAPTLYLLQDSPLLAPLAAFGAAVAVMLLAELPRRGPSGLPKPQVVAAVTPPA